MTRLLASAGSPEEAEIAIAGGADLVDLTVPGGGTLAALSPRAIRAAVNAIGKRRPVSAAAGNPGIQPAAVAAAVRAIAAAGADYVRLGIVADGDAEACIAALAGIAAGIKPIAVFFADASPDFALLPLLRRNGFVGAMIDTRNKTAARLLDCLDMPRLLGFVEACHASGLIAGLAGSLETPDIPRLLVLAPDILGFRGALCGLGDPAATLDPGRVQTVRGLIPPHAPEPGRRDVDYRLLTPRGYAPAAVADHGPVDLVFVDDLVLPVFIGAYARERDAPQNVRFAVTASVMRGGRSAEDMRDVFSYDLITDGIRLLIGSGHVALVETLAERIAAMVLGHPRVARVVVRVQKLDTGSGTVGVEIERTRMAVRAIDRPVVPLLAEASGQS